MKALLSFLLVILLGFSFHMQATADNSSKEIINVDSLNEVVTTIRFAHVAPTVVDTFYSVGGFSFLVSIKTEEGEPVLYVESLDSLNVKTHNGQLYLTVEEKTFLKEMAFFSLIAIGLILIVFFVLLFNNRERNTDKMVKSFYSNLELKNSEDTS